MMATLLVIPDKNDDPTSKVELDGTLDPSSISLNVDYFGEAFSFSGWYDGDDYSVIAEMMIPERRKFLVSTALPRLSLNEAQFQLEIVTPFIGYRNMSFFAEHTFDGENLKTRVLGGIEEAVGDVVLTATVSSREVSISTDVSITGYPKYQGTLLVLRKAKRKSFQLGFKNGAKESLLDFDFIRLDEGYVGKLDFYGCPFLPKVHLLKLQITTWHIFCACISSK